MRRLQLRIKSGNDFSPFYAWRECRDEEVRHDYEILKDLPSVESIVICQKSGENWLDYLKFLENTLGDMV